MPECRKCGAELHDDQKMCIKCGTRTPLGGGFDFDSNLAWRPSPRMLKCAGGVLVLVIIALILNSMRTTPPEVVAGEWFSAIADRRVGAARDLSTPQLESDLQSRMMDLPALADEYYTEIDSNGATYEVGNPTLQDPTNADVTVILKYPGADSRAVRIKMIKVGRQWRVNAISG